VQHLCQEGAKGALEGHQMNIYQVRTFNGKGWDVIRTYAIKEEATDFAKLLLREWDVKTVLLEEVNSEVAA
jgi:hypothetical protein